VRGGRIVDGRHCHLAVANAECLDPSLLAERQRDEVSELDYLLFAELRAQPVHQGVVDTLGVPDQEARVQQCGLLALVEPIRALELEQLVVVLFGWGSLSSRERPLRASVVAVDRLRDVNPAKLL